MEYLQGDLIKFAKGGKFDVIVHGCNCFNTMGSGVAKLIKENYPGAWTIDQETSKGDRNKLGTYTLVHYKPIIVNAYTQFDYGTDGKDRFEYEAFWLILQKLKFMFPKKHFGMPYIGCGLAGGDESRIVDIISKFDHELSFYGGKVTLVKF
jgi:O-acetyl-ADP-ribose deacetylase (regulator of RNase III)